jgi:thiol-disulfide isomerase/thioredoxin
MRKLSMKRSLVTRVLTGSVVLASGWAANAHAADPTAEQALKLVPIQKEVDFDRPGERDVAKCTIKSEKEGKASGWAVYGPAGEPLRRFVDTNGDGQVDLWCYFKNGLEVYRDIDSDYNLKADQYRWFNTAGTRWGIDEKEDRSIDQWKCISAEEASQEIVAAIVAGDAKRFSCLLLTDDELTSLGVGSAKKKEISDRLAAAPAAFAAFVKSQKAITTDSDWSSFGSSKPGLVPSGTEGSTKDVVVYENVSAVVETKGKHEQVLIGTLVQVGSTWRIIDAPQLLSNRPGETTTAGIFFRGPTPQTQEVAGENGPKIDEAVRKVVVEMQAIDKQLAEAAPAEQNKLNARRAALLRQLIDRSTETAERTQWTRQFADTVSLAVQSSAYDNGLKELEDLLTTLEKSNTTADGKAIYAYVRYRYLTAQYSQDLQEKDADIAKVQTAWIESLTKFAKEYADSPDGPDAMLQLAIALESSGKEDDAIKWYGAIAGDYASASVAKKAIGAKTRLESVGKRLALRGRTIDGKTLDVSALGNRVVLVHYWASYSEPCIEDFKALKQLYAKYGQQGFLPVGVCLDHDPKNAAAQLKQDPLPWPQLYEAGGLENSRLANEMGIVTLPVMLLVDKGGKVVNRNIHVSELEPELKKLLKSEAAAKPPARPAGVRK